MHNVVHTPASHPLRGTVARIDDDGRPWLSTPLGVDIECTSDDAWTEDLHLLTAGTTVVIHSPLWKDDNVVHIGADALLVIEPAAMVDVTEFAELVQDQGLVPEMAVLRRLLPRSFSSAAAIGSLVNAALDALVEDPNADDRQILQKAEAGRPIALAHLVQTEELLVARDRAMQLIPVLRQQLTSFDGCIVSVESTFASPDLGMIGRVDLLIEDPAQVHHKDIIELKAGSAPKGTSIRPSHRAQVAAYDLLLESVDPDRTGITAVWYPGAQDSPMRATTADPLWRRMVVQARNRIAVLDQALAARSFTSLQVLRHGVFPSLPRFLADQAGWLAKTYAGLDAQERTYLQAWISYVAAEQRQQRLTAAQTLWSVDADVKRSLPSALTDLSYDPAASDIDRRHLRFLRRKQDADCSLRLGDLVVVYPAGADGALCPWASGLVKGAVRAITSHHVDISLRNKQASVDQWHLHPEWAVEQDVSDGGLRDQYTSLATWLATEPIRRAMLMGRSRPETGPPVPVVDDMLMPHQHAIVERALGARHWFLIQGPPGTGKTNAVIRSLTKRLMENPAERVLLLAFTNRAADEICAVVERTLGPDAYVRLGSKDGSRGNVRAVHALGAGMPPEELHRLLMTTRCMVSTVAAMSRNTDLLEMVRFTTTIVDEASQVLEPQLLGLLSRTGRFILVGDECQLPAVITQPSEGLVVQSPILADLGLTDLGTSYFARLMNRAVEHGWDHVIGRLTEQGRMHDAIGSVASTLFYGGMLRPMHAWQSDQGPWLHTGDDAMDALLRVRMGCVHVSGGTDATAREADIVAGLASRLVHAIDAAGSDATVGIITPFRTQINAIQHRLPEALRTRISVDTVERYQGSERDVIVVSAAVASSTDIEALSSVAPTVFGPVDRKLNVMVTRARQQFILVGDLTLLRRSDQYSRLLDQLSPLSLDAP